MYRWLYRNFLSRMDPEKAHNLGLKFLKPGAVLNIMRGKVPKDDRLNVNVAGIDFENPIGMAAGFDKNATVFPSLLSLGFGYVEIGTATMFPREGNKKPRIWRQGSGLFNRMGLPGLGADTVANNIMLRMAGNPLGKIGVSISPTNPFDLRDDLVLNALFLKFYEFVDYITVNLSCPNVREDGLYDVNAIVETLSHTKKFIEDIYSKSVPIFVKSAASNTFEVTGYKKNPIIKHDPDSLKAYIDLLMKYDMSGIILVNTLPNVVEINGKRLHGGISGPPLIPFGIENVHTAFKHVGRDFPIIGVGGIENATDVLEYIGHGASLVQLYTGFVNYGPRLPANILNDLLKKLEDTTVEDFIGVWA